MISILNPRFVYRDSSRTDIRRTFASFRREQAAKSQSVQPVAPTSKPVLKVAK